MLNYIKGVLGSMPADWLKLTTHRLDIYDEKHAKEQFLSQFYQLYKENNYKSSALKKLPTAYDYIRLGHPLSCILEWVIAHENNLESGKVISFSSSIIPLMAILRKNLLDKRNTVIYYDNELPQYFDAEVLKNIYGYIFDLKKINSVNEIAGNKGSIVYISHQNNIAKFKLSSIIDFYINHNSTVGSILLVNGKENSPYISEIQHVRRRETIAMTPANSLKVLNHLTGESLDNNWVKDTSENEITVLKHIKNITGTTTEPLVASSGLSIQYAILMGLVHFALEKHKGKAIKIIVPPNCYGGTNDQAKRVAACLNNVEIIDLPVDAGDDMVKSIDLVLDIVAKEDAIPYIIAEIPTNPRVEVPDLNALKNVLSKVRKTYKGDVAIDPVFILDQTFCPNVRFLEKDAFLHDVRTISFASGSKFPSGGLCTAGYCVSNDIAKSLMDYIENHLNLCDNNATDLQMNILANQLPSMTSRIKKAYKNTLEFVTFIHKVLPEAKINFVSDDVANAGFTPSVFSLDLPAKGNTDEEREEYKRALNLKLINLMITKIPHESKFCVSYGQLKGCYWTIPATSTQGTTKEDDKDYIVRVSVSPNIDLELHKKVFLEFVKSI